MKPIIVDQDIDLPTCMYKMDPINLNYSKTAVEESKNNSVSIAKKCQCGSLKKKFNIKILGKF